ncbi:L,D-transpeptidase [Terricaulis sp.]|uniref:L,D-transpeptidase n=1 Tax=Terricaulis sp. TaxID=2768686 RepID=UPI0037850D5A
MSFHAFATGWFTGPGLEARCTLGRGGVVGAKLKREGDGATPIGAWPIRCILYRPDREPRPETALDVRALSREDGWCDAPNDPAYNTMVRHPYPSSAEHLWRDDHVYDLIVVLGFNDDPVVSGKGSAIFWHLAREDFAPTEGCVAVARDTMLTALRVAQPGDTLAVIG